MTTIAISSGHSKIVRGANKYIDEVAEARKVVDQVAIYLKQLGVAVHKFHDDTSQTQTKNLTTIIAFHNAKQRDYDYSIHFNASSVTDEPRGVEVLHYNASSKANAAKLSKAIADASGLKNRGAKERTNLAFLKNTNKPANLIEICFVDSKADVDLYKKNFDAICRSIAETIANKKLSASSTISVEDKVYRLFTGTFKTLESAEKAAKKITDATGLQIRIREE